MPGLSRIAYRSFWPQERYNRQFAEAGDPFYANDELIALHSGGGGRRTFRLPEARKVTELFEERTVSDSPVMEFTETFEPMETRLYWLERN